MNSENQQYKVPSQLGWKKKMLNCLIGLSALDPRTEQATVSCHLQGKQRFGKLHLGLTQGEVLA